MVQAENYILRLNAEAYEEELVRRQALPGTWTPMDAALNTQLFEVDSASPEVASLVQALQQTGATIVKVSPLLADSVGRCPYSGCGSLYKPGLHDLHPSILKQGVSSACCGLAHRHCIQSKLNTVQQFTYASDAPYRVRYE